LNHLAGELVIKGMKGHCIPSKSRIMTVSILALRWNRHSAIFLDFFTPASSPEPAEVHEQRTSASLRTSKADLKETKQ
jgi:hypothetical protein